MTIEEAIRAALIAEYDAIPPKEELEKMRKQEKYDEMLFNQTWSYTRTRKRRKR